MSETAKAQHRLYSKETKEPRMILLLRLFCHRIHIIEILVKGWKCMAGAYQMLIQCSWLVNYTQCLYKRTDIREYTIDFIVFCARLIQNLLSINPILQSYHTATNEPIYEQRTYNLLWIISHRVLVYTTSS